MIYSVTIRDNRTGLKAHRTEDMPDDELVVYNCGEGNYSCDCNRRILFENKYICDSECGSDRYSVQVHNKETGELVYQDGEGWRHG